VISRLRRLFLPEVRVQVREVEGPEWPAETRVSQDLRDIRYEPETPNVELERITAERLDFSGLKRRNEKRARCSTYWSASTQTSATSSRSARRSSTWRTLPMWATASSTCSRLSGEAD